MAAAWRSRRRRCGQGAAVTSASERPTFLLRLRPEEGIDPIRALRRVLKFALRACGMRATVVVEERNAPRP